MASIGLTIPALALMTQFVETPLILGLGPTHLVLFVLTVVATALTIIPGRATRLQAMVHLTIFAAFIFLAMSP